MGQSRGKFSLVFINLSSWNRNGLLYGFPSPASYLTSKHGLEQMRLVALLHFMSGAPHDSEAACFLQTTECYGARLPGGGQTSYVISEHKSTSPSSKIFLYPETFGLCTLALTVLRRMYIYEAGTQTLSRFSVWAFMYFRAFLTFIRDTS